MKRIHILLMGACMLLPAFTACEKDLEPYNQEDCGVYFYYGRSENDTIVNYSFAFGPQEVVEDTVRFEVRLMGDPVDYDRIVMLEQVMTGKNDAVAGKHFVPFDDATYQSKCVLPKNATSAKIPVVLKRDPSLKTEDYNLKFTFKLNEVFSYTAKESRFMKVLIADQLIKPTEWDDKVKHFFGEYGKKKHQLMIDATGKRWDNDYITNEITYYLTYDQNMIFGLNKVVKAALEEYNATHETPLTEEDGTPVALPM